MAKVHIRDPLERASSPGRDSPSPGTKLRTLNETVAENIASQISIVNTVEAM